MLSQGTLPSCPEAQSQGKLILQIGRLRLKDAKQLVSSLAAWLGPGCLPTRSIHNALSYSEKSFLPPRHSKAAPKWHKPWVPGDVNPLLSGAILGFEAAMNLEEGGAEKVILSSAQTLPVPRG